MNPAAEPPPPPPPQPPRSSFSCDKHPEENFTGFCPLCLCERLTTLDQTLSAAATSSSSTRPSAAAALKSILKFPAITSSAADACKCASTKAKTSFFPELRRSKSFSASKNEAFPGVFEPQRKSCDVRGGRSTLWSLFSIDDENKPTDQVLRGGAPVLRGGTSGAVLEANLEEVDDEIEEEECNEDEIQVCEDEIVEEAVEEINDVVSEVKSDKLESEVKSLDSDVKRMKDHIDLEANAKKTTSLGGFWSAASVFSKKWHKWRRKQKIKKSERETASSRVTESKTNSRRFRETQSEIADYGFGRRSCDTAPRFSLDAARISFEDGRYSFDQPRASWDGHLIGRTFARLPPMVEDDAPPVVHVPRCDMQIPVEQPNADENIPGGMMQTREYYIDSSSKRRKSLDRSNSIRKTAAAVVAEMDEMKAVSNARLSSASIDSVIRGGRLVGGDSNSNSLREDRSETFELGIRDNGSVIGDGEEKKGSKKSRRWRWNIWAFIIRRSGGGSKDDEEERYSSVNGVGRSYSASWQEYRREGNCEPRVGINGKVLRSNSSVSWRNSYNMRNSNFEMNGNGNGNGLVNGKTKREEFVLEKNRSARYSPNNNNVDNGLLRFYMPPMRSGRRVGVGMGKSRPSNPQAFARSVAHMY